MFPCNINISPIQIHKISVSVRPKIDGLRLIFFYISQMAKSENLPMASLPDLWCQSQQPAGKPSSPTDWLWIQPETLYHREDALLYIAYVMLIWAAPIPADRWHCSLWP